MKKTSLLAISYTVMLLALFTSGCVERKLTINTRPEGALVTLNDEEIGNSPVTVSFNWYGDYAVRINKQGFETLNTHKKLVGPWYDKFPFDFFAQILSSKRIVDSYQWTFELTEKKPVDTGQLVEKALEMKEQL